jgi:hypothetical protein
MTRGKRDAFDVLASADPARAHASFDPASSKGREVLERAVGAAVLDVGRRRGRVLLATAVALAALAAAAAAYVHNRQPSHTLDIGCYSAARGQTNVFVVVTRRAEAVEACWDLWRSGKFAPVPTPTRLTSCVLESGSVGVFPGGADVCAKLGRPLAGPPPADAGAIADMRDRLVKANRDCLEPGEARRLAEELFDKYALDGWTTSPAPNYDASRPCTEFSIDEVARRVTLVPAAR